MSRGSPSRVLQDRQFNHGHQTLPSGLSAFPVARKSPFHRSINQKLPELWPDFSDRGAPNPRMGHHEGSLRFHGDGARPDASAAHGQVVFCGFAEFDMDGRVHTAGEMDRLMLHAAASKYPCARPATFDEYSDECIVGLPKRNTSGRDVVFVGLGATGCELNHTNTLGAQKTMVPPGDPLDGTWNAASMYGRKALLCVIPLQRLKKQQSLTQFGLARESMSKTGRQRRTASLSSLTDQTPWTTGDFGRGGSTNMSQKSLGPK